MNEWIPLIVALVPAFAAVMAYRAATRANQTSAEATRAAAESAARGKFTDDLQEELKELRSVMSAARREADELRVRTRVLTDYLYECMAHMRRHGVEPPPVPAMVRLPWEGPMNGGEP